MKEYIYIQPETLQAILVRDCGCRTIIEFQDHEPEDLDFGYEYVVMQIIAPRDFELVGEI